MKIFYAKDIRRQKGNVYHRAWIISCSFIPSSQEKYIFVPHHFESLQLCNELFRTDNIRKLYMHTCLIRISGIRSYVKHKYVYRSGYVSLLLPAKRERINKRVSERGGWPMQIYAHTLRVKTRREREKKKERKEKKRDDFNRTSLT